MRLLIQRTATGFLTTELPATKTVPQTDATGKIILGEDKKPIMQTVPLAMPVVLGNARVFEGDAPPTQEQMQALFAPTYRELRAPEYADPRDLFDALTKKASTDPTIQAEGAAQEAAYYAHNLTVKAKYPKSQSVV